MISPQCTGCWVRCVNSESDLSQRLDCLQGRHIHKTRWDKSQEESSVIFLPHWDCLDRSSLMIIRHYHYLSLKRERELGAGKLQMGAQRKTMIQKLAPENENKRESDTRQVLAAQASLMQFHFNDSLTFVTRTRTRLRCREIQKTPESFLEGWPMYGKRERAPRFQ